MAGKKYNHMVTFAFEIRSDHPQGETLTGAQLKAACRSRLDRIPDDEMIEACMPPQDTYVEKDTSDPETHSCEDCLHTGLDPVEEPCKTCTELLSKKHSCWEPKED